MFGHSLPFRFIAFMLIATIATSAAAAKKPNKKYPNNRNNGQNGASQARKQLADAQRGFANAQGELGLAQSRLKQATHQTARIREEVEEEKDHNPSLQNARRLVQQVREELETQKQPVLEKLSRDAEYRAALAARDEWRGKLAQATVGDAAHGRAEQQLKDAMNQVHRLEVAALAASPAVKNVQEQLAQEEADVRKAVERRNQEVDGDSRLNAAKNEIQKAKAAVSVAEATLRNATAKLAAAQNSYAQRSLASQAKKNNKGNGKNNPKRR